VLGPILHALGDRLPHHDIASRRFEIASGVGGLAALAAGRGVLDSATVGALACMVPDVEHVVRLPRPGGRKLFPSHRRRRWHRSGGVPAPVQLVAAGLVLGAVASSRLKLG
jgi:hypothetical protein